jgi:hypothetical protein
MLGLLFESREQRDRDRLELRKLVMKYGDDAKDVVKERAADRTLSDRDRTHWRRIARKI